MIHLTSVDLPSPFFSDESDLVPSVDGHVTSLEDQMIPVTFSHILHNHRVRTERGAGGNFRLNMAVSTSSTSIRSTFFQLFDA